MNVSIIIPAYNEEFRLPHTLNTLKELIEKRQLNAIINEILVVDDGSKDQTIQVAQKFISSFASLKVIESGQNYGKGHAIHLGLRQATQDYILIADADMATPWTELNKLAKHLLEKNAQGAIASRDLKGSELLIKQSWIREHLGKCFNVFVRLMTGLPFKDTQCGFKLFNRKSLLPFMNNLKVNDFAWDVELLIKAQNHKLKVLEIPVVWQHIDESRVHPVYDGLRMILTVLKIRFGIIR